MLYVALIAYRNILGAIKPSRYRRSACSEVAADEEWSAGWHWYCGR